MHAQGFDLCSSYKRYVCITQPHAFLLDNRQCLLKKLYLRSENDPAKEMHTVTHKKETMKDTNERGKYKMLEYATYYTLIKHETTKRALEYGADAISMFGLIMLCLQHIILKLILYQK